MARVASETAPSFFAVAGVIAAGLAPSHRVASFSSIELTCSAADIPSLIPVGRDRLDAHQSVLHRIRAFEWRPDRRRIALPADRVSEVALSNPRIDHPGCQIATRQ